MRWFWKRQKETTPQVAPEVEDAALPEVVTAESDPFLYSVLQDAMADGAVYYVDGMKRDFPIAKDEA